MIISVKCPSCGREFRREFDDEKIKRIQNGEFVQRVFPELNSDERELFFISHICGECWNTIFREVEEEMEEWLMENDAKPIPLDVPQEDVDNFVKERLELIHSEIANSK